MTQINADFFFFICENLFHLHHLRINKSYKATRRVGILFDPFVSFAPFVA